MEVIFLIIGAVTLLTGGLGTVVYKSAPDEWRKTFARAAFVTRANLAIKTGNAPVEVMASINAGTPNDQAIELWEQQYTGKGEIMLVNKDLHYISKSWNELSSPDSYSGYVNEQWWWECNCGEKEHRKNKEAAKNSARRHIQLYGGRNSEGVREQGWLRKV